MSEAEAYQAAGYKPNDGNCIRLNGNERVQARVRELKEKAVQRALVTAEDVILSLHDGEATARGGVTGSSATLG